jgi:hypothetical protein
MVRNWAASTVEHSAVEMVVARAVVKVALLALA